MPFRCIIQVSQRNTTQQNCVKKEIMKTRKCKFFYPSLPKDCQLEQANIQNLNVQVIYSLTLELKFAHQFFQDFSLISLFSRIAGNSEVNQTMNFDLYLKELCMDKSLIFKNYTYATSRSTYTIYVEYSH